MKINLVFNNEYYVSFCVIRVWIVTIHKILKKKVFKWLKFIGIVKFAALKIWINKKSDINNKQNLIKYIYACLPQKLGSFEGKLLDR